MKNNRLIFVTVLTTLLFGTCKIYSQPIITFFDDKNSKNNTVSENNQLFDIRLGVEIPSASMRYDKNSKEILEDSLIFVDSAGVSHKYEYTTDFNQQKYSLQLGYLGVKNLYFYVKFPFSYTSIEERFKYDSIGTPRISRNQNSKFYVEGSQFNAGYSFKFGFFNANLLGELFFPFYKYNSNVDTTDDYVNNKIIQLGRALEMSIGTKFDFNLKPVRLELGGIYNSRSEDFSNRLLCNFAVALSSIENTELYANFIYATSLGDYDEKFKVNFWRQTVWEKYFDANIGFKVFFSDEFYANIDYVVRLWGENTLAFRTVNINLGYIIQK